MPTRNVVLTDRQSRMVDELVLGGEYQNASEVLREGLRLVEERREQHAARLAALRAAIQEGLDDSEAGRYTEYANFDDFRQAMVEMTDAVIEEAATERR
jgi:antitoxin ParD1/3/4